MTGRQWPAVLGIDAGIVGDAKIDRVRAKAIRQFVNRAFKGEASRMLVWCAHMPGRLGVDPVVQAATIIVSNAVQACGASMIIGRKGTSAGLLLIGDIMYARHFSRSIGSKPDAVRAVRPELGKVKYLPPGVTSLTGRPSNIAARAMIAVCCCTQPF